MKTRRSESESGASSPLYAPTSATKVSTTVILDSNMNVLETASSSRQSSSSPGGSPSRSSTPSQSSASSDFLPSDGAPLTPWTPYAKHDSVGLFDEDTKPSFDAYYTLGMPNAASFQTSPTHGMLLEDLMQEDAYECVSYLICLPSISLANLLLALVIINLGLRHLITCCYNNTRQHRP